MVGLGLSRWAAAFVRHLGDGEAFLGFAALNLIGAAVAVVILAGDAVMAETARPQ